MYIIQLLPCGLLIDSKIVQIRVLAMTPFYTLYTILLALLVLIRKYDKKVKLLALHLDKSLKNK